MEKVNKRFTSESRSVKIENATLHFRAKLFRDDFLYLFLSDFKECSLTAFFIALREKIAHGNVEFRAITNN